MNVIPCVQNLELNRKIEEYAECLKLQAPQLGDHGLTEDEFYQSGLFRGAIERIRGQYAATMREKRDFVKLILNHMQDRDFIKDWTEAGHSDRHDYSVTLPDNRIAIIELKGAMDGNNTNIFLRPPQAHEFILWSVSQNQSGDPRKNVWSGIHTRLSADIISNSLRVDGLVVWDMVCGTIGRPCPKLEEDPSRFVLVGQHKLPPPCVYVFPATTPTARDNPMPPAQPIENVQILNAINQCFGGRSEELNSVTFEVASRGADTVRTTRIYRNGVVVKASKPTPIKRSG